MSREIRYRFYPSLLDVFQAYLDSDMEAESFWNIDNTTGDMKQTAEEVASRNEQRLLDAVNRVEHEMSEAADRGTCFNEVVDRLIGNGEPVNGDVEVESGYMYAGGIYSTDGELDLPGKVRVIAAENVYVFLFDAQLCREAAEYFGKMAVPQHYCHGLLDTSYGLVELHGYADEIVQDRVYDIKTTGNYQFGKYERGWQKELYPYCLVQSGEMQEVKMFEYTVFQLSGPTKMRPYVTGKMYREQYTYDHVVAKGRLTYICEAFIEWLENNRGRITDDRVFNGRKESHADGKRQ